MSRQGESWVAQEDELVRRINLLEILGEEHEDVQPPPEDAARLWCGTTAADG